MNAHVYLFGDIGNAPEIGIKGISAVSFIAECQKAISNGAENLIIHIDSNGGLISEGETIASYIRNCPILTTTINEEKAYSISSEIYLSGSVRKFKPNAKLMIHNNWVDGLSGDADEIKAAADLMDETEKKLRKKYVESMKLSDEVVDGLMKNETYITAEEAVNLGICDEILTEKMPIVAKYIDNKKSNKMATKSSNFLTGILNKILNVKESNMLYTTAEGVELFIESEGGLEGKTAVLVVNGEISEEVAPAGTHTLNDGTTIVVDESGVVTSAQVAAADDEDDKMYNVLKEENAALKAELEIMKSKFEESNSKIEESNAKIEESNSKVEALEANFIQLAKAIKSEYVAPANNRNSRQTVETSKGGGFSREEIEARRKELKK
jgi:ATP-dependent protease ClpP protease subunit